MHAFLDLFLHLDHHLLNVIEQYGTLTYVLLFLIIFCETGLVVTPFLPGDSLIFAAGAFAASGQLHLAILFVLLLCAAIGGNMVNYAIGRALGEAVFNDRRRVLRKEYLDRTHAFYEKYGAKTIVLSRFVPIVRTVAPFVAGAGTMNMKTFVIYNAIGGVMWVSLCLFSGYFFGNLPFVQKHFSVVLIVIVGVSVLPMLFEWLKHRKNR